MNQTNSATNTIRIGWNRQNTTPAGPVLLAGQFYCRVSEGVRDPIGATALALDNRRDHVVLVSVDLVSLPQVVHDMIIRKLAGTPGLDPSRVIISTTHSHTAPELRGKTYGFGDGGVDFGVDLVPLESYRDFFSTQVAVAIRKAWQNRAPGSLAYGMTRAVLGHNRRWVDRDGASNMYGDTTTPTFDHIEGYEDSTVNVLATWDEQKQLTGMVLNVPCPSQLSEHEFQISSDYWHETRELVAQKYGKEVYVLGQCSVAGDQSPRVIWDKAPEERMLRLKGRTPRQELAHRLVSSLDEVLPYIQPAAQERVDIEHLVHTIELPLNQLTQKDRDEAEKSGDEHLAKYEAEKARIDADPSLRGQPRWYKNVTFNHRRANWFSRVIERYDKMKEQSTEPATVHVVRIGDMVLATNPYEYYLDYGVRIRARSPFEQTVLVQLAGHGTYVPSERSVAGGGYGSMPASNPVGVEGGKILCEKTIEWIHQLHASVDSVQPQTADHFLP